MTTWKKAHHKFCLANRIKGSILDLYQVLTRKSHGLEPEEMVIDLRQINTEIGSSRGDRYDRKTMKWALAELETRSDGLIVILNTYHWAIHRIIIKPVEFWQKKNCHSGESVPNSTELEPANINGCPQASIEQQQQSIDRVAEVTSKVGLRYDRDALLKIWRLSGKCIDRVKQAIELMLYRHNSTTDVTKPHGFLIECLKRNWQENFNIYYQPELPKFERLGELRQFVSGLWAQA